MNVSKRMWVFFIIIIIIIIFIIIIGVFFAVKPEAPEAPAPGLFPGDTSVPETATLVLTTTGRNGQMVGSLWYCKDTEVLSKTVVIARYNYNLVDDDYGQQRNEVDGWCSGSLYAGQSERPRPNYVYYRGADNPVDMDGDEWISPEEATEQIALGLTPQDMEQDWGQVKAHVRATEAVTNVVGYGRSIGCFTGRFLGAEDPYDYQVVESCDYNAPGGISYWTFGSYSRMVSQTLTHAEYLWGPYPLATIVELTGGQVSEEQVYLALTFNYATEYWQPMVDAINFGDPDFATAEIMFAVERLDSYGGLASWFYAEPGTIQNMLILFAQNPGQKLDDPATLQHARNVGVSEDFIEAMLEEFGPYEEAVRAAFDEEYPNWDHSEVAAMSRTQNTGHMTIVGDWVAGWTENNPFPADSNSWFVQGDISLAQIATGEMDPHHGTDDVPWDLWMTNQEAEKSFFLSAYD